MIEIGEQQTGPRFEREVTQGVEESIPGDVRDGKDFTVVHTHETELTPAARVRASPLAGCADAISMPPNLGTKRRV